MSICALPGVFGKERRQMQNIDLGARKLSVDMSFGGGTTLVVGSCPQIPAGSTQDRGARLERVQWSDLDQLLLSIVEPDLILSPLVSDDFDCVDVAFRLTRLGYKGRYVALTEGLPHPAIVRREVRSLCPHLDFDIVETRGDKRRLQ